MNKTIIGVLIALLVIAGGYWLLKGRSPAPVTPSTIGAQGSKTAEPRGGTYASGGVIFSITDAAANLANVSEVAMTVDKVEMHSAARGWVTVSDETETYRLLALKAAGESVLAARSTVEAGTYNQIRAVVERVEITRKDGSTARAKLPSGQIIMNGQVVVSGGTTSSVNLDFLADASLHTTGKGEFIFTPVVRMENRSDAAVTVGADNRVTVSGGRVTANVTAGMDLGGEMKANFRLDANGELEITNGIIKVKGLLQ